MLIKERGNSQVRNSRRRRLKVEYFLIQGFYIEEDQELHQSCKKDIDLARRSLFERHQSLEVVGGRIIGNIFHGSLFKIFEEAFLKDVP